MGRDDQKTELHLTPKGWIAGSRWLNDRQTKTVNPPVGTIETWTELISDSSEGWDPPVVFHKMVWECPDATPEVRTELNTKFPRPEHKPWVKPPRRSKKNRRTVFDY